jgi:uncharacterized membrane protein
MVTTWIDRLWQALPVSSTWMTWNLFLAIVPLALSLWLFRRTQARTPLWWVGMFAFVAFLPNSPYVLTDVIHLVQDIQSNSSLLFNTLVVIPKYVIFVLVGFEAYVLALINLGNYLRRQNLGDAVLQAELALHGLCAIGVYLGRFERFNSWDLMTRPHHVVRSIAENLLDPRPLFVMIAGFGAIAGLYWVMKEISLALSLKWQREKAFAKTPHQ